jgi:transcription initiation factor TFIID TATA-box-binding protein
VHKRIKELPLSKVKASVSIVNIVASVNLNQSLDLNSIIKAVPRIMYKPQQFPGAIFKLKEPKTAHLLFRTGKMVCTGAKSGRHAKRAVMKVIQLLKENSILIVGKPTIKVVNIVASARLGGQVDLEKAIFVLERTMYEPEQFPGLIYRMNEPKVVILIFTTGELVITGAKTVQVIYQATAKLQRKLEEEKLISYR